MMVNKASMVKFWMCSAKNPNTGCQLVWVDKFSKNGAKFKHVSNLADGPETSMSGAGLGSGMPSLVDREVAKRPEPPEGRSSYRPCQGQLVQPCSTKPWHVQVWNKNVGK